jgi:transposase
LGPLEVGRLRRERRSQAKSDALDALATARSVLGQTKLAAPRAGGRREALRALMVARAGALAAKKGRALPAARSPCHLPGAAARRAAAAEPGASACSTGSSTPGAARGSPAAGHAIALRSLARRVQALSVEERELKREIETRVAELAPLLLAERGVGPVSAAQALLPGRITAAAEARRPSPASAVLCQSLRAPASACATDSIPAAIASSTAPCTRSS